MLDKKEYDKLTLEELLIAEKKVKQTQTIWAAMVGFLVGVMVFGVVKNGFGWVYIIIPLMLILIIVRNSKDVKQNLKEIQAAINNKNKSE